MPSWAVIVALCLLLTPLISLVHQAATLAIASSLQLISHWGLFSHLAGAIAFDPVYASVLDKTLGNIEVRGVAIAAPLGDALHKLTSGLFASPDQGIGAALVTPLVGDGASLLAVTLAESGGEVFFVVLGLALFIVGLIGNKTSHGRTLFGLRFLGVALQFKGVVGLLSLHFSPQDLEIMGIAHIFTKLLPLEASTYQRLAEGPVFSLAASLLPISFVFAIYGPILAILVIGLFRYRSWRDIALSPVRATIPLRHYLSLFEKNVGKPVLLVVAILAGAVLLQRTSPALASYEQPVQAEVDAVGAAPPDESLSLPAVAPPELLRGPSKVLIEGSNYSYSYTINGKLQRIQGVGYNAMYSKLPLEERAIRYSRDFAQMRSIGINTILGWNQQEFDELTLEKAQENGLGVVMPYYLPPNGEYGNPEYEQKLEADVKEWVQRFKASPALRMWGIGNEVIHGMREKPDSARALAFALFYLRLADSVHAIDPDHPIMYRDAEDIYVASLKKALQNDGIRRSWLAYGANFFTFRIEKALDEWPQKGPDMPLVLSEFAPCGLGQGDRPAGFLRMWRCITQHPNSVLGGFAYVWSTDGPEAIDRVMGLVNDDNRPVDASLFALRQAFFGGTGVFFDDFPPPQ